MRKCDNENMIYWIINEIMNNDETKPENVKKLLI